jgi:hypothetical protein
MPNVFTISAAKLLSASKVLQDDLWFLRAEISAISDIENTPLSRISKRMMSISKIEY